ncbi:MAG TPA: glycosyltransferase [Patescibacteria group bacterium]|nr:glycosyltransferase [Patescibacteria group bacterium]
MRILLVNKYWYLRGGAERVSIQTKQILEAAGHTVEIFGMHDPKNIFENKYFVTHVDYAKVRGLKKISAGLKAIYNPEARDKFRKLVEDFQPDVVHLHNFYHQLSGSILEVLKEKKIRTVMTLHDYKLISPNYNLYHHGKIAEEAMGGKYYRCLVNNCMERWGESFIATIEAYFLRWNKFLSAIDWYLSPSRFLKDKFVQAGFPASKITVVPNPIEINLDQPYTEGDYITYIGRVAAEKGLEFLLQAAKQLPDLKFRIVGDGLEEKKLKVIANELGLGNVEFLNHVSGEELEKIFAEAKFLVLPSVWYENYPMSVLEACLRRKVVIASRIGGIPELLPEELLFEPGDIESLVSKISEWVKKKSEARETMGNILRVKVMQENNEEQYLRRLEEVYLKC